MRERSHAVLLIESNHTEAGRLGSALRGAEHRVVRCGGPGAGPCPVEHGGPYGFTRDADVVLLDLALETEASLEGGVSPGELLAYYLGEGKPVIVLTRAAHGIRPFLDERVQVLDRPPTIEYLSRAIVLALRPAGSSPVPSKVAR